MRICLIAPGPIAAGGPAGSVATLARALADRHEVTLIRSGEWDELPPALGGGVREMTARPSAELRGLSFACEDHFHAAAAMEAIRHAYADAGPDYIEVPDFRAHGLVALQARLGGEPLLRETLIAVRAWGSAELLALHDGSFRQSGLERLADLEREQLRLADRLLWPGGDTLELYRRHYRDIELPSSVELAPLAPPASAPASPGPLAPSSPLRLLFVGHLRRRLGALDLVEACLGLPDEDWVLTLFGADTATASMGRSTRLTIEAMAGEDGRIRFEQPEAGEVPCWHDHDLLVLPARFEPWAGTAIEAMQNGLPVLATPTGALPEIVGDGGWIAEGSGVGPIRRALARLLGDREELQRVRGSVADRGARLAEPARCLAGYERLFDTATAEPAPLGEAVEEPLVTGVVPYYRTSEHVAEAVGSLLGQTHRNLEVLIVNDGSFEPPDSVLARLEDDPRVRVVTKPNGGEATARNLGAVLAEGEFVAMLDADNVLEPRFVERAVGAFRRRPELAYATCWLRKVGADGAEVPGEPGYAPLGNGVLRDERENWDGDAIALLPRRLFAEEGFEYDTEGSMHADWELYRLLRSEGRVGTVIPEPLARYRIVADSLMRAHSERLLEEGWNESRDSTEMRRARRAAQTGGPAGEEARVEELLRANAELAAELRRLVLGRTDAPRSSAMPTARRLSVLIDERDELQSLLQAARIETGEVEAHRDEIERRNTELAAEVERLRGGLGGYLRRARARLRRR